jgi:gliding motility-associated lipoprotein GldH
MKKGISLILLAFILSSCDNKLFKAESVNIDGDIWEKEEVINMPMTIADTSSVFDYYVTLRNSEDYKYQNIFLFIDLEFPNGRMLKDTLGVDLAGTDGKWKGKGSGSLYDNRILVNRRMKFPLPGEYNFHIRHAMRDESLEGIKTVGVEFEYVQ